MGRTSVLGSDRYEGVGQGWATEESERRDTHGTVAGTISYRGHFLGKHDCQKIKYVHNLDMPSNSHT